jgi:XTP/dITP diphosphohydrolase
LRGPSRTVFFATHNKGKFIEAAKITSRFGINLKYLRFEKREIQSDDLAEIASFAAKEISDSKNRAVLVEDAGFFVSALNGFPGPYSAYVFDTLGTGGILKILENNVNRRAFFKAAVAYCAPRKLPKYFTGVVDGLVSRKPRGTYGFGFDPIFLPRRGSGRTFAEMSTDEKNSLSHRALAFEKFSKWFATQQTDTPS